MSFLKLTFLFLILPLSVWAGSEQGEENPLVADTFTKKKHVRYFGEYETVDINYLEAGDFQAVLKGSYVYSKVAAESTSASPIAYSLDNTGGKWVAAVGAKYGITDAISAGVQLSYTDGTTDSDTVVSSVSASSSSRMSGIQDLELTAQFALPLRNFGYVAELVYMPSIGTSSFDARSDEGNAYHEQSSLELENHFILKSADIKWGGILSYRYAFLGQEEQISSTGVTTTREISGGNSYALAGFVEFERLFHSYFGLSYLKSESRTQSTPGGVTTDIPALDYISVVGMAEAKISRTVSFVPKFQYITVVNKDVDPQISYTQVNIFSISGEIRMLF